MNVGHALAGMMIVLILLAAAGVALGEPGKLVAIIQDTSAAYIGAAFGVFVGASCLRAIRFGWLAKVSSYWSAVSVTVAYQVFRAIMPAQAGELSYPILAVRAFGTGVMRAVADLVFIRSVDVVLLAVVMLVATAQLPLAQNLQNLFLFGGVCALLFGLVVIAWGQGSCRSFRKVIVTSAFGSTGFGKRVRKAARQLEHGFRAHGAVERLVVVALSCLIVGASAWRFYFQMQAIGIPTSITDVGLVLAVNNLLDALPIRGFGGVGVKQGGVVAALMALGAGIEEAVAAAAVFSVTAILFPLMLGPVAWSALRPKSSMGNC